MAKRHEIDMTEGSILKKVLQYALPMILSSALHVLFHSADTVIVGRFAGSLSMAAVGSTGSLVALLVNLFTGLAAGTNVMSARYYGSREYEKLSDLLHTSIAFSLVLSLLLGGGGALLARPLLVLMKSDPAVLPLSALYLQIYFLGTPFQLIYLFASTVLRALGDTKRPLFFSLVSNGVNILLNLLFVVVLRMDVAGVAIATALSHAVSCFLVLRVLARADGPYRFYVHKLKLKRTHLWDIVRIGLPVGLNSTVFNIANVSIQSAINSLGTVAMAGDTAARTLDGLIATSMSAFLNAVVPFTSQNVGAKKYHRLGRIYLVCTLLSMTVAIIIATVIRLLGVPLLGMFIPADDPARDAVIAAGLVRLTIIGLPYFLCGMLDVASGFLRGTGRSWTPFLIAVICTCAVRIAWISLVFPVRPTAEILYLCFPLSWLLTAIVTSCFSFPCLWKYTRQKTSA